jgi:preprotein translocase subunit SecD
MHDEGTAAGARDYVDEAVEIARANPKLGVGLHLTLLCGHSALSSGEIPGLVNAQNEFTNNATASLVRHRMKPSEALRVRTDTLSQSINTIEKKINALGLAESSVQQRGGSTTESELLVQLPGVDDPARVKQILKTAAILELYEVVGGPYSSRDDALAQKGGVLPLASLRGESSHSGSRPAGRPATRPPPT